MVELSDLIRCTLYQVGTNRRFLFMAEGEAERPEVVQQLLDTMSLPSKPSYAMAPEQPLVLHRCGFDRLDIPTFSMQPAVTDKTQHSLIFLIL